MKELDKEQLNLEISHIFSSGANHERIFNMVELFISQRYELKSDLLHNVVESSLIEENEKLKKALHEIYVLQDGWMGEQVTQIKKIIKSTY
jgi:hypothetical protein